MRSGPRLKRRTHAILTLAFQSALVVLCLSPLELPILFLPGAALSLNLVLVLWLLVLLLMLLSLVTLFVAFKVLLVGLATLLFKDSEPLLIDRAPLLLQNAIRLFFPGFG